MTEEEPFKRGILHCISTQASLHFICSRKLHMDAHMYVVQYTFGLHSASLLILIKLLQIRKIHEGMGKL